MKISRHLPLPFIMVFLAASPASGLDGQRQGFVLNPGLGFGLAKHSESSGGLEMTWDGTGVGGTVKTGLGLNEQVLLLLTARGLWYSEPEGDPRWRGGSGHSLTNGMLGLGASYYLQTEAPSWFLGADLGLGIYRDNALDLTETGLGAAFSLGFEFAPNFLLEATYLKSEIGENPDGSDHSISSFMFSASWFGY